MDAIIVAIGDEVLRGQTINSNAAAIAKELYGLGFDVIQHSVLKDDLEQLVNKLPVLAQECDLLITTGGLGPTTDDKTRNALAKAFGWTFYVEHNWLSVLEKNFNSPPHVLQSQAMIPEGSQLIQNLEGTACGFMQQTPQRAIVAVLPGVPGECLAMIQLFPGLLANYFAGQTIKTSSKLHFFGVYERYLDFTIKEAQRTLKLNDLQWGLYPDVSKVTVVLHGETKQQQLASKFLLERYGHKVFSGDLLSDLSFYTHDRQITILESVTAGLMRWQASHYPDFKVSFELTNGVGWLLKMEQLLDSIHIVISLDSVEKVRFPVPIQGSLNKRQKRCATLGYGLLLELFREGRVTLVPDPTTQ